MTGLKRHIFPAQLLDIFQSFAAAHGVDEAQFWHEGVGADQPGRTFDGDDFLLVLQQARRYADPGRPLSAQLLEHMPLTAFGALGVVLMSSSTLRDAIEAALRYYPVFMPAADVMSKQTSKHLALTVTLNTSFNEFDDTLVEVMLGTINRVRQHLLPGMPMLEIHYSHDAQFSPEAYSAFADPKRLVFNAPENSLLVPVSLLDQPLENANRSTLRQFTAALESDFGQLTEANSWQRKIRQVLIDGLQQGDIMDLPHVALQLNVSERSLGRHLQQEGATFRAVALSVRMAFAANLMRSTTRPVSQIARAVGYDSVSSFCRAFQRCHQSSPQAYRNRGMHAPLR